MMLFLFAMVLLIQESVGADQPAKSGTSNVFSISTLCLPMPVKYFRFYDKYKTIRFDVRVYPKAWLRQKLPKIG